MTRCQSADDPYVFCCTHIWYLFLKLGAGGKDAAVPSFGSNIRTTVKAPRKGKAAAGDGKGKDARKGPAFERGVANCLCCGKIFNSRAVTNDLLEFLGKQKSSPPGQSLVCRLL